MPLGLVAYHPDKQQALSRAQRMPFDMPPDGGPTPRLGDLDSPDYRAYLIEKHGVEHHPALHCHTLGVKIFASLDEALLYAHHLESVSRRRPPVPPAEP
jgi:hypothetical protein